MDDKQRIEYAKWQFERTLSWVGTADVKVGVAMALDTAMLGGLAAAFGASQPADRTYWCYLMVIAASIFMMAAVGCSAMAAIPRVRGPIASMIFFARVKESRIEDYCIRFKSLTEAEILDDLTSQIHRNSEIAYDKHWWVRKSLIWSFVSAIPWSVAIALLVKT